MLSSLVEKVSLPIGGWMMRFLSMGGRVTLVNSVLNAIGVHCMMVLPVPISSLNRIISMMSNFIWDSGGVRRRHWKCWEALCRLKQCGGLGIRDPKLFMQALHAKLAWSCLEQKSLWARYCKARYRVGSVALAFGMVSASTLRACRKIVLGSLDVVTRLGQLSTGD
ncbi:hypothetical protein QQ045_001964 [Rhodiola kirilowii]